MFHVQRTVALLAVGAMLVVLPACGAEDRVRPRGDDPIIFVQTEPMDMAFDVDFGGRIEYDPDSRCLRVGGKLAMWPPGTEPILVDGVRGVQLPGDGIALEGDRVSSNGRLLSPEVFPDLYEEWLDGVAELDRCAAPGAEVTFLYEVTVEPGQR